VPWTYNVAVIALVAGFVTARLAFVASHWSAYQENLVGIVWPLTSGFNTWAGLAAGALAAFFYGRARRLTLGATADALAPGLLLGFLTISLADFLAGPGYGVAADLPWSVDLFGVRRHPVQLYEILAALLGLLSWIYMNRKQAAHGQLFLFSIAIYSAGRLFVDAYRANAPLTAGGYHLIQLIALATLLVAIILLMRSSSDVAPPEAT
jgi:phosphatidylglycerol:prolipoprotein diacylglycerol transferase